MEKNQDFTNCNGFKNLDKRVVENTKKLNNLDKMMTVDIAIIRQEITGIGGHIGEITKLIGDYIESAKETFVTQDQLKIYVKDGKYGKLWAGVVMAFVGVMLGIVGTFITALIFK